MGHSPIHTIYYSDLTSRAIHPLRTCIDRHGGPCSEAATYLLRISNLSIITEVKRDHLYRLTEEIRRSPKEL